jgi:TrwC relaxase
VWIGSGMDGIDGLAAAEQMRALLGCGLHPLAELRQQQLEGPDLTLRDFEDAARLGVPASSSSLSMAGSRFAGQIAKDSRPRTQTVAGYDLTFSPVKSVSRLWAVADPAVAPVNGPIRQPCAMHWRSSRSMPCSPGPGRKGSARSMSKASWPPRLPTGTDLVKAAQAESTQVLTGIPVFPIKP